MTRGPHISILANKGVQARVRKSVYSGFNSLVDVEPGDRTDLKQLTGIRLYFPIL